MKALKNRLIIKADMEQKSVIKHGTLTLYMPPNQDKLNQDGKVANPVVARVVGADDSYPHIQEEDLLLLNHNILNNLAFQTMEKEGSEVTLVIPIDKGILGKISNEGEVIPLCDNVLVERIYEAPVSSIIFTPESYRKTEQNKVKVVAVSPEAEDIEVGKTAIVHKYSDYEVTYNHNERRSAIIVWSKDIVATQ